ncbi:MAG: two-component system, OmpR family, sensor kinase [Solirubrobacteraceae bacterium]|jgi:two-component system OmpR family sensor kinase|nr:two-component system, OmpR family, sensor kinase [Solirubrobacteraceae bacterium]
MNAGDLRRLRLRLTLSYAAISLTVLAVLAGIAVKIAHDRRYAQLDDAVERTVLAADGYAYPEGEPSKLVVDKQPDGYFGPERRPSAPVVVVNLKGRVIGGPPRLLDAAAARRARDRALKRPDTIAVLHTETVAGRRMRIADSAIFGSDGQLGAIVSALPVAGAASDVRATALKVGGGTLALWLLTIAAGWFLAGRALVPAVAMARREEAFLADAAHELRTPVAVIRARAEQGLRELGTESEAAGALRAIEQAAERASGTIADMLELARLDARRGRFEREPMRLDLLVEQIADEYTETAAAAGAELKLGAMAEVVVEGDERLLTRALANLVENAIRYGAVGGEIVLSLERSAEQAIVRVADRGPGVPPAQRGAIFDRFHRASGAAGGSGLGLAICRLVAEAHDGTVVLEPAVEDQPGAVFALSLPLAP